MRDEFSLIIVVNNVAIFIILGISKKFLRRFWRESFSFDVELFTDVRLFIDVKLFDDVAARYGDCCTF